MKEERERKGGEEKGGRGGKGKEKEGGERENENGGEKEAGKKKNGRVRERRIESPRHLNEGRLPCVWHLSAIRTPQVRHHLQEQKSNTWCEL